MSQNHDNQSDYYMDPALNKQASHSKKSSQLMNQTPVGVSGADKFTSPTK